MQHCSVLYGVAECCRLLQIVAECCRVMQSVAVSCRVLQCVAVCCTVLQFVAVCCSVLLQYAAAPKPSWSAEWWRERPRTELIETTSKPLMNIIRPCCSVLPCLAVSCRVLQCVAVCCSVLYRVDRNHWWTSSAVEGTKTALQIALQHTAVLELSLSAKLWFLWPKWWRKRPLIDFTGIIHEYDPSGGDKNLHIHGALWCVHRALLYLQRSLLWPKWWRKRLLTNFNGIIHEYDLCRGDKSLYIHGALWCVYRVLLYTHRSPLYINRSLLYIHASLFVYT